MKRSAKDEMGSVVRRDDVIRAYRGFEIMLMADGCFAVRNAEGHVLQWRGLSAEDAVEYLELALSQSQRVAERMKIAALYNRSKRRFGR